MHISSRASVWSLLLLCMFGLVGCGGGGTGGGATANPNGTVTDTTATTMGSKTTKVMAEIGRVGRGGMLLKGKLRAGAFPSADVVTVAASTSSTRSHALVLSEPTAGCPVITRPEKLTSAGFTITLDYGAGCVDTFDGVTRSGKIVLQFSNVIVDLQSGDLQSATVSWTFNQYSVGDSAFDGSVIINVNSPILETWDVNVTTKTPASTEVLRTKSTVTTAADTDIETVNGEGTRTGGPDGDVAIKFSNLQFDFDNAITPLVCQDPVGGRLSIMGNKAATLDFAIPDPGCGFASESVDGAAPQQVFLHDATNIKTDLRVTIAAPPGLTVGSLGSYATSFVNAGPFAAHQASANITLSGVALQAVSIDKGTCSSTNSVVCTITMGTLNPGDSTSVQIAVTPSATGQLTTNAALGSADVSATNLSLSNASAITSIVSSTTSNSLSTISLKPAGAAIPIGGRQQFTAIDKDGNTLNFYGGWRSSNEDVATIDDWGVVTALKSGTTIITANIAGATSSPVPLTVTTDTIIKLDLPANDLIYDPRSSRLYASVPSSAGARGNTITIIDPQTAHIERSIFVGSEPNKLAISDDGQFLYVGLDGIGAVRRFDIATQTPGLQFSLGADQHSGLRSAKDIKVVPGQPHSIVVAMVYSMIQPSFAGITAFDDNTPRPNVIGQFINTAYEIYSLAFSKDSSTLYGLDVNNKLLVMSLDASGITIVNTVPGISGITIELDNGVLYSGNGQAVAADTYQLLGKFDGLTWYNPLVSDSKLGKLFALVSNSPFYGTGNAIVAYDLNTFVPLAPLTLPAAVYDNMRVSLVRWGDSGLAFTGGTAFDTYHPIFLVHWGWMSGTN